MTITTADIKLLASERMTDQGDGGGAMTGTALQDGAENQVFPDISSTDRAFGRLALRKVYGAVLNAGTDTLLGAHSILNAVPTDADVGAWMLAGSDTGEDREAVALRLAQSHWLPLGPGGTGVLVWTGTNQLTGSAGAPIAAGSVVFSEVAGPTPRAFGTPVLITSATEGASNVWTVTYDGDFDGDLFTAGTRLAKLGVPSTNTPRIATTRPVSGSLSAGATYCSVDTVLAQLVPKHWGSAPGAEEQTGIEGAAVLPAGVAAAFRQGDGLVLHHTASTAPATATNGGTVDCGRTNLSSVRVIGNNGAAILSGWTANLATGVVTHNTVTGWSQPVHVDHTIEEVVGCARTGYPEVPGGAVVGSNSRTAGPFTLFNLATMYCGRTNVGQIKVYSKTGQDITDLQPSGFRTFILDLVAGTVTANLPTENAYSAPLIASHSPVTLVSSGSGASAAAPSAPQADLTRVTFNRPLTRAFPSGTRLSSMLLLGDLQALAGESFSQVSWTDVWSDSRIGSAIAAQYQQVAHPIIVSNLGAATERWAIIFTSSTAFRLVGETRGQIATGTINDNLVPINPATTSPYFTVAATGWGSGWSTGNVLRFNTVGANAPVWVGRTVRPSAPNGSADSITIALRGDIDA